MSEYSEELQQRLARLDYEIDELEEKIKNDRKLMDTKIVARNKLVAKIIDDFMGY